MPNPITKAGTNNRSILAELAEAPFGMYIESRGEIYVHDRDGNFTVYDIDGVELDSWTWDMPSRGVWESLREKDRRTLEEMQVMSNLAEKRGAENMTLDEFL